MPCAFLLLWYPIVLSASCVSPSLRGDPGFTAPTAENAPVYKAAYESFQKTAFSEASFVSCGEKSKGYELKEREDDESQIAKTQFGVNLQCKYCLAQGCGYCFVAKKLVGESSGDMLFPGNLSRTNISISNRSQCFYDPGGYLCSSRLQSDVCTEHIPRYIDSMEDCFESQQRNDFAYLGSLCASQMAPQLLIPLQDTEIFADILDLRVEQIDLHSHSFDASVAFALSWTDRRLADSFLNACGENWIQVEREVCGSCDETILAKAQTSATSSEVCACRDGGLVWNAVSALEGNVFSNAIWMERCTTLTSDYRLTNQSITRTFVCNGKFSMKFVPSDLNITSAGKLDMVLSLSLSTRSTYGLRLAVDSSRVSLQTVSPAGFQPKGSLTWMNASNQTKWDSPILQLRFESFRVWLPVFASFFPVVVAWLTFLLPATQLDSRTRKDQQLSPVVLHRILATVLAIPCILQATWREEAASIPTDAITVNLTMTLLLLLHAQVVARLLLKRMAGEFPTRRQQDYNKRVLVIVSLVDRSVAIAFPVLYLGILQRSMVVYFDQSRQAIAVSNAFLSLSVLWYVSINFFLLRRYFQQKQEDLKLLFELFDTDNGGTLSVNELDVALSNYGYEAFEKAEIMQMLLGGEWHKRSEAEVPLTTFLNVMGSPWISLSMWLMSGKGSRKRAEESLKLLNERKQEDAIAAGAAGEEEEEEEGGEEKLAILPPVLHNFGRESLEKLEKHLVSKRAAANVVKELIETATLRTNDALRTLHVVEQLNVVPSRSKVLSLQSLPAGQELVRGTAALPIDRGWTLNKTKSLVRTIQPASKQDMEAVRGRIVDSLMHLGKEAEKGTRSGGTRRKTGDRDDSSSSVSSYDSQEEAS